MRPSLFGMLLFIAGCATHQAEQKASLDAWGDCVMHAVARLDDGKSDPMSIANGIAPGCAVLYQQFTETMVSDNITERGQAAMRDRTRSEELRLITSAILTYRSGEPSKASQACA
jgi:hypothetical protein